MNKERQIYLDMDGVLADFTKKAKSILGMDPDVFESVYGTRAFWKKINSDPHFYLNLEMMEDAHDLYEAVKHLKPIILTGIPKSIEASQNHKTAWAEKMFGNAQKIICCLAREKFKFCHPGDILIDDMTKYKHLWEEAGGTYIIHTSAQNSIRQLQKLKIL